MADQALERALARRRRALPDDPKRLATERQTKQLRSFHRPESKEVPSSDRLQGLIDCFEQIFL